MCSCNIPRWCPCDACVATSPDRESSRPACAAAAMVPQRGQIQPGHPPLQIDAWLICSEIRVSHTYHGIVSSCHYSHLYRLKPAIYPDSPHTHWTQSQPQPGPQQGRAGTALWWIREPFWDWNWNWNTCELFWERQMQLCALFDASSRVLYASPGYTHPGTALSFIHRLSAGVSSSVRPIATLAWRGQTNLSYIAHLCVGSMCAKGLGVSIYTWIRRCLSRCCCLTLY